MPQPVWQTSKHFNGISDQRLQESGKELRNLRKFEIVLEAMARSGKRRNDTGIVVDGMVDKLCDGHPYHWNLPFYFYH